MYNFFKVTNQSGVIQFQHPDFHRDRLDRLHLIKRKNPSDAKKSQIIGKDQSKIKHEMKVLQAKVDELNRTIKTTETQNKTLLDINREEVAQFFFLRKDCELKSFRLLFLFHSMIANYHLRFVDFLKEATFKIGWTNNGDHAYNPITPKETLESFMRVIRQFSSNKPEVDRLLQRLIFVFIESVKSKDGGPLSDFHRSRQINTIVNDFTGKIDANNSSIIGRSFKFNVQSPMCRLRSEELFTLEQQLGSENESMVLDLKSENFEDIDRSASQALYSSSNNDSVCNSYHRSNSNFFSSLKATSRYRYK